MRRQGIGNCGHQHTCFYLVKMSVDVPRPRFIQQLIACKAKTTKVGSLLLLIGNEKQCQADDMVLLIFTRKSNVASKTTRTMQLVTDMRSEHSVVRVTWHPPRTYGLPAKCFATSSQNKANLSWMPCSLSYRLCLWHTSQIITQVTSYHKHCIPY